MVQLAQCVGRLVGLASEIMLYQEFSQLNLIRSLSQDFFLLHDENRARQNGYLKKYIRWNVFFLIKPTDALISQIYFVKKLYMVRAVPLPIIRSFPQYIRHWYTSCMFDDSFQARPGRSCLKAGEKCCLKLSAQP
jgi:hypothetical protein